VVVLEDFLCSKADKIKWSGLGNQTVRIGGHCKLVPASVLVSVFTSRTLFHFATTSSGVFPMLGLALPLAEDSLFGHVFS
jgi:hypothetical protein